MSSCAATRNRKKLSSCSQVFPSTCRGGCVISCASEPHRNYKEVRYVFASLAERGPDDPGHDQRPACPDRAFFCPWLDESLWTGGPRRRQPKRGAVAAAAHGQYPRRYL